MGIPFQRFISISFNFQVGVVGHSICFFWKIASRLRGEWASIHSRGLFETPRHVGKKPTFPNVISKWRFEFSLNFAKGIGISCHRNQNWHPFSSPRFLGGKSWRVPWLTMDPCPGAGFSTYERFGRVAENLTFEGFPPMSCSSLAGHNRWALKRCAETHRFCTFAGTFHRVHEMR